MSAVNDNPSAENADTALPLDDEDQLQPGDTLDGTLDPLDRGYSPNDRPVGVTAWGTTAREQGQDETIDQRIEQELPDPTSAYGRPENESGLDVPDIGGDDPDAVAREDDFVGDAGTRSGRLVAPDQGVREDDEDAAVGTDVGIDGGAASAEEAAVHVVSEAELDEDGNGIDDLAEQLAAEERELAAQALALGITPDDVADLDA